ncbi:MULTISPECIES: Phenylacetic acid catabolic protein [Halorubrum]|jgi:ring-1,2-phenylacetyl-CoA epoxidase subunit PaaA|uniref:1,2-phenylacetyl-CoA epoxidase subunit A n=1 Tax=Halorubrum ezzemoulense TaxID=337243 RepID=A0A256KT34_HALEZ|nr:MULTISPECIES: Phenylacetic acid catabolic protein [Halorubrum]OYR83622.1 1,2-phenylacetyl-CoA epoxidase subunit A [Halorubrum ezzemoulense]QAY21519.1 1,2-phenylacetyl-CoA epoxidase subunit A [Halorubrum ezzemoulense]RLM49489.1 1,2-phenylacetyl-CoA epoxidase subunit A [Halorubrum sp. Atlit-28R]
MNIDEVKERAGPRAFNPRDDMPEEYRKAATRMLEFHANSEIMGAYLERPFIRKAPSLERKMAFSAKTQDEIGHGQMLYRAAEALGIKTRDEMLDDLAEGRGKFLNCFHYPMESYVETPMIAFFVDGAAMRRQATLKKSSWEPYAHAMDKICFEEGMHVKHGESILRELMNGSIREQEMTQEAFEKWWPRILQFFGPTDDKSTHHGFASEVGLKTASNDELRNSFLNTYMPKAERYGLEIPDEPRIRDNGDGTYEVVEDDLDWDEFFTVSKNEYEGSKQQINGRAQSQKAVQWVRDMMDSQTTTGSGPIPQAAD